MFSENIFFTDKLLYDFEEFFYFWSYSTFKDYDLSIFAPITDLMVLYCCCDKINNFWFACEIIAAVVH